ncbi:MAG: hypothetical protein IKG39_01680 [Lachnospiraceae bacterium]|nr:hypothetical protein [Lachnospiraceae bacterium]
MEREIKRADPYYSTDRWEHLRQCILRRDDFMCQDAKRYGKRIPAEMVHHIFPREIFPEYQWEPWNLISLSNKAHDAMHYRTTRELTDKGMELLIRTARKQGIDLEIIKAAMKQQERKTKRVLVIGLRGSGKTTYCRENLGEDCLVYDLDAIASSFRLKREHEEVFDPARRIANDYLFDFIRKSEEYKIKKIFIIRAAPEMEELEKIRPDQVVHCSTRYIDRPMKNENEAARRIVRILKWCEEKEVEVTQPPKKNIPPGS